MKRITLIGTLGTIAIALLAPAAVSAAVPVYATQVDKAVCRNDKGAHGFGKVVLQMRAWGRNDFQDAPTPNYIRIVGRMDQKIDGIWVKGSPTTATTPVYPDGTAGSFQDLLGLSWDFPAADHPRTRMVMRIEFWDDLPSGDVRLRKVTARTEAC